jgi:cytochrome b561
MSAERQERYSNVSILLHWTIAALIIANVVVGGRMEDASGPSRFEIFQLHKSIGITVLILSLIRLGWRLANPAPRLPKDMARWEKVLARFTHVAFYVAMIGIPLTGWATVSASPMNIPTLLWGGIPWPDLPVPEGRGVSDLFGQTHETMVKITYAIIALHVLGALKHHFINKDHVLARMLPLVRRRSA